MKAFAFDETALEKIAKRRQATSKIYIVLGYQFKSDFYDSTEFKKNITDRINKLQNLLVDIDKFDISLEFRPLKSGLGTHILEDVSVDLASADIAIFEISDQNPNVFLEMGIALSHGVSIIPFRNINSPPAPSDIDGLTWIEYDKNAENIKDSDFDRDFQILLNKVLKKKFDRLRMN